MTEEMSLIEWEAAASFRDQTVDRFVADFVSYGLGHVANYYANLGKPAENFDVLFFARVLAEMAANKVFLQRIVCSGTAGPGS